ncbi:MAG TPA: PAS domain-containing protein [Polyangiaceae bacterium]|nr:PAS domain-containing protein [Polyangiaceae bacterium]
MTKSSMAPGGSLSFDDGRIIRAVSEAGLEVLGRARADLIGASLRVILPLPTRVLFDAHLWPRLALHGRADNVYVTLLGAADRHIPVLLTAKRATRGGVSRTDFDFVVVRRRDLLERELSWAADGPERPPRTK